MSLYPLFPQWCSPVHGHDIALPGDYIIEFEGKIVALVVRRVLFEQGYLVIPKYVRATSRKDQGPWRFAGDSLRRVITDYSPREVSHAVVNSRITQKVVLPIYGVSASLYTGSMGMVYHCSGEKALQQLIKQCRYSEVCLLPHSLDTRIESLRLTGSLLLDSLHPQSDIDVVIGDYRAAVDYVMRHAEHVHRGWNVVSAATGLCRTHNNIYLERIVSRGLSPRLAREITGYIKKCINGRPVSVSLVSDRLRSEVERRRFIVYNDEANIVIRVEGFEESILDFPAIVITVKGEIVVSFDAVLALPMFRGGCFYLRGLRGRVCFSEEDCVESIFIGIREFSGFLDRC